MFIYFERWMKVALVMKRLSLSERLTVEGLEGGFL
jgi:hypothetical protein